MTGQDEQHVQRGRCIRVSDGTIVQPRIEDIMYRVCLGRPHKKTEIFLHPFCIDLRVLVPQLPPGPTPLDHLNSLATIVELTTTLPAQLPMKEELRRLATQALEAAVADLGDNVQLHTVQVEATTADRG